MQTAPASIRGHRRHVPTIIAAAIENEHDNPEVMAPGLARLLDREILESNPCSPPLEERVRGALRGDALSAETLTRLIFPACNIGLEIGADGVEAVATLTLHVDGNAHSYSSPGRTASRALITTLLTAVSYHRAGTGSATLSGGPHAD